MKRFSANFSQAQRQPAVRSSLRPGVEQLEERRLLSLTYHGGPLLQNPDVEILYYGSQWLTDPTLKQQANQINQFFQVLTDSAYMDMLNEYNVGRGSFVDAVVDSSASARTIDDTQLQSIVLHDVGSGLLAPPDGNRLYFVFTPPGTEVTFTDSQGTLNTSGTEANDPHFIGYHSAISATLRTPALYYAVVPYPGGINILETGLSVFQQMTLSSSHELAESATDPDTVTGWIDDSQIQTDGGEIADLANGLDGTVLGYDVAYVWSNAENEAILPIPDNLEAVAAGFTTSTEYYTALILNDYQQLLGRTPAQAEINLWLGSFRLGARDEQVMAAFLASPEYYQHVGGTNKAWIDSLYTQVLGRKADAPGDGFWLQALAAGRTRTSIAYGFTASAEHEMQLIQDDYQLYLGRQASTAEVSAWLAIVNQGMTQEAVAAQFAASAEAFFLANNSNVEDWLTYAYRTILNRAPDTAGFNSWDQVLQNGLQ
jgi:hypothetical protein